MKSTAILGIVLMVVGIISLGYQGFTYTTREKVINLGPIQASADVEHTLPPFVGALALAGGIGLLLYGNRKAV